MTRPQPSPKVDANLKAHFVVMQGLAARYLMSEPYIDREGNEFSDSFKTDAFINDMIYMLDGPEHRAAQASPKVDGLVEPLAEAGLKFIEAAQQLPKSSMAREHFGYAETCMRAALKAVQP